MYRKPSHFSLTSIAVLSAFLLVSCGSDVPLAEDVPVRPAILIEVGQKQNSSQVNYPAVIKSKQLSALSFEVGGVLKELLVVEAQAVEKGDVLATLDQRNLKVNLESARAQYDAAESDYQRAVRLMKEDAISRSELEKRSSTRTVNKAQLTNAEKALQDSVIVAPYAGNIAKISVQEQQAVQAGAEAIHILGAGGLEAVINLPSTMMARAPRPKELRPDAYLILDAASDRRIPAFFKEASLEADPSTQTYEVTFTFNGQAGLNILPGMNATVWLQNLKAPADVSSSVTVPLASVSTDGNQKYVWVVHPELMTVARRDITLERSVGANLSVSSGLTSGETIVAAGVSAISEGMKVRPWSNQ